MTLPLPRKFNSRTYGSRNIIFHLLVEFDQYLAVYTFYSILVAVSNSQGLDWGNNDSAVCMSFCLISLTPIIDTRVIKLIDGPSFECDWETMVFVECRNLEMNS
jgi:hypothetical protein